MGILKVVYHSRSTTTYRISDMAKVKEVLNKLGHDAEVDNGSIQVADDLLDLIIGFDDMKEQIMRSLKSPKPVHFLFVGPPSSAKSILLLQLDKIPGCQMVLGGSLTKVGIRDLLIETRPPILLVDEIEKVENIKTLSVLLSLMSGGYVIKTISGDHRKEAMNTRVFACANRKDKLSPELMSRFATFVLRPYTAAEFHTITTKVLIRDEGKTAEMASYIADKVASVLQSFDVRAAIRVARLSCTNDEVDKTIAVMRKYSEQIVLVSR
jgi:replication-associated recombination protein RarA